MEQFRKMLCELYPNIDFDSEKRLVSEGILDSLAVVSIIAEIEMMFDMHITMEYIQPVWFESVEAMWKMIEELR